MDEEYELKQVKVRLKLAEAEPLYSTEQITTPDKAAEVMAQALAQLDREYCCVVNLDGANHPINFNVVSIGDVNQAHVPIQNVFKSAILSNASSIMMFHNHPSGSVNASKEDIEVTKRLIEAGQIMNIPVLDHIIVAGGSAEKFSFRTNNPEMFQVAERAAYAVHEPGDKIFADSFTIYQLKDDDVLHDIRFESLDYLKQQGIPVDKANYDEIYTAPLQKGETLDDLFYRFNMEHPQDFHGHSMSMSDVVVLHHGAEDKAYYVDRIGFAELPEFLLEKTAEKEVETIGSLMEEQRSLRDQISAEEEKLDNLVQGGIGNDAEIEKVSDNLSYLREELEGVSDRLDKLYELQDEEYDAQFLPDELAFKLADRYITIQTCEEGYDYSIYDEDYHLLDGGVYDDPAVSIRWALDEIVYELKVPRYDERTDTYLRNEIAGNIHMGSELERVDFDELMEQIEAVGAAEIEEVQSAQIVADFRDKTEQMFVPEHVHGETIEKIESAVRDMVQEIIDEYGMDARIEDVIVSGSRCRGLENADSDLDVVVSFSGNEREDTLFNLVHEDHLVMGGVTLDIDPISTEKTGTLAQYLPGVEKYLSEKAAEKAQSKIIAFPEQEKPKEVVTFTVAESSEFHSFGELHEGIPTLQEALEVYQKLCDESVQNSIPALGINLHTIGTKEFEDVSWDFLSGGRLDLEGLMYLPEMSQNAEVVEALHQIAEAYPQAEAIGHFPDERETSGHDVQKSEEELTAEKLAAQIDAFEHDFDPYDYGDRVEDSAENISQLVASIESGDIGYIRDSLQEIVDEQEGLPEEQAKAKELLQKLSEYKPLAKVEEQVEQNYNMIDNVINNLPQDPEEKKEPAPQKEMRVAEVKKVRKRVSMKKLLAEKKVEVAERDKKPPEQGAPSKRQGMGVDD